LNLAKTWFVWEKLGLHWGDTVTLLLGRFSTGIFLFVISLWMVPCQSESRVDIPSPETPSKEETPAPPDSGANQPVPSPSPHPPPGDEPLPPPVPTQRVYALCGEATLSRLNLGHSDMTSNDNPIQLIPLFSPPYQAIEQAQFVHYDNNELEVVF